MEFLGGFLMALADSVPGVSGGTIAFIVGIYDRLVWSISVLGSGTAAQRRQAALFLVKVAAAWAVGFALAAALLSHLFEQHIYVTSSVFMGLIVFAVPLVVRDELPHLRTALRHVLWTLVGLAAVVGLTWWNTQAGVLGEPIDLGALDFWDGVALVFTGLVTASVMLLPGMSGSTVLLVLGLYVPLMGAVKGVLGGNFALLLPCGLFAVGALLGLAFMAKVVERALERFRSQTVFLLVGLMLGSLYAVALGPASLEVPLPAMGPDTFSILGFLGGGVIIGALELLRHFLQNRQGRPV